jgi:hypothetical protein
LHLQIKEEIPVGFRPRSTLGENLTRGVGWRRVAEEDRSLRVKLGCFLPILAVGLVALGAQGLYVGLTNQSLVAMTYREFLQKKPSSGWIEISDARLDLLSAIHESNRFTGAIKRVYIPVGSSAEEAGEGAGAGAGEDKIHLLLLTKDEAILKTMKDLEVTTGDGGGLIGRLKRRLEARGKRDPGTKEPAGDAGVEKALRFLAENRDKIIINRPVRGLLQFGLDSNSRDRRKIQALDPKIAPDFAVLEDGTQPQIAASAFMVVAGIGLAGLLLARAMRAGPSTKPAPGSPGEPAPPEGT